MLTEHAQTVPYGTDRFAIDPGTTCLATFILPLRGEGISFPSECALEISREPSQDAHLPLQQRGEQENAHPSNYC
jgi:hypothetical protein